MSYCIKLTNSWIIIIILIILCIFMNLLMLLATQLEYRIQNGYPVNPGEFPMIVLLLGNTHLCTGTIIAPDKVLTAGHCACGDPTYEVHANLTQIDERFSPYTQFRFGTQFNYPITYKNQCDQLNHGFIDNHDEFGGSPDISILTLNKKFNLMKGWIEIGSLNYNYSINNTKEKNDEDFFVLGYGEDKSMDNSIGQLRLGIIKLGECPKHIKIPTNGAICSNINRNHQGPDVGDSGGPIFDINGRVIGITSIAGNGWYVFSSVTTHKTFIQQHLYNDTINSTSDGYNTTNNNINTLNYSNSTDLS